LNLSLTLIGKAPNSPIKDQGRINPIVANVLTEGKFQGMPTPNVSTKRPMLLGITTEQSKDGFGGPTTLTLLG
jgi:hypothetical protein